MSELKLLAYPALTPAEDAQIKAFLQDITIVELNSAVKSHAIELRKHHGLKLPDAIIAATALTITAIVLINDCFPSPPYPHRVCR